MCTRGYFSPLQNSWNLILLLASSEPQPQQRRGKCGLSNGNRWTTHEWMGMDFAIFDGLSSTATTLSRADLAGVIHLMLRQHGGLTQTQTLSRPNTIRKARRSSNYGSILDRKKKTSALMMFCNPSFPLSLNVSEWRSRPAVLNNDPPPHNPLFSGHPKSYVNRASLGRSNLWNFDISSPSLRGDHFFSAIRESACRLRRPELQKAH